MKYFGFITVKTSSSRLKKKCLLKFGRINIIEHIILRTLKNNIIPIVCTTVNKSDNVIEKISKKYNVYCFRGSAKNKIKRWHDCAKKNKINYFHTIDADDPFFDPIAIKRSINKCKLNYDIVFPSVVSRAGGASEGYSFSYNSILKLNKLIKDKYKSPNNVDTEMIEKFIDNKNFKIKILKGLKYEVKNIRLTLDYKEDYEMLTKVRNICGNFAPRKKINYFLKKNKNIIKINFFRRHDWQKKQKKLLLE